MTAVAAARDDAPVQRKSGAETTTGATTTTPPSHPQQQQQPDPPPQEQGLRCPRCDSPNTKFCYYNNYSLSQPRHFCKSCRRYWTKGGALRNVPVGGGCRKNKRSSRSAAALATSRLLALNLPVDGGSGIIGDQRFLGGGGAPLVGNNQYRQGMLALPRIQHAPSVGQYVSFEQWASSSGPAVDLTGVGGGNASAAGSIASTPIESRSFINQDLHWKLQQQRLATMFLLHTAEAAPPAATTSWFVDSSHALPYCPPPPANTAAAVAITTDCNIDSGQLMRSGGPGDDHATSNNNNCGSGSIPETWRDMSTFAVLP